MAPAARPPRLLRPSARLGRHLRAGNDHFIVTGAGGWFGSATLELLEQALGPRFEASVTAFARTGREGAMRGGGRIRLHPLAALADLPAPPGRTTLLHYAFLTPELAQATGADAYVAANRAITALVAAQGRRLRPAGVFSTSSGAVYRRDGSLETGLAPDLVSDLAASPYGVLKLEEEAALARLRDAGAGVATCRVFNVAGPFLRKDYAIGSLVREALTAPALRVRARHRVLRSYAHVADVVGVGLAAATGLIAAPALPFDSAGDEIVEVGELAERIRLVLGCRGKPIERSPAPDPAEVRPEDKPEDRYIGDLARFAGLAEAAGLVRAGLDEQIRDTAAFLADEPSP